MALSLHPGTVQASMVPNVHLLDKIDSALSEHWKGPLNSLEFDQLDQMQSRTTNTIVHVCWQRTCSISASDYRYALTVSFNGLTVLKNITILF